MALAKPVQDETPASSVAPAAPAPQINAQPEQFTPAPSPVLQLQRKLRQRATAAEAPQVEKWSARRSVALIVSASAALWLAILMAGTEATKLVA